VDEWTSGRSERRSMDVFNERFSEPTQ
jgi:hypothetical protein